MANIATIEMHLIFKPGVDLDNDIFQPAENSPENKDFKIESWYDKFFDLDIMGIVKDEYGVYVNLVTVTRWGVGLLEMESLLIDAHKVGLTSAKIWEEEQGCQIYCKYELTGDKLIYKWVPEGAQNFIWESIPENEIDDAVADDYIGNCCRSILANDEEEYLLSSIVNLNEE